MVGRIPLYLLDTDIEENTKEDRAITHHLYGGDWNNKFDDFNVDDEEEDSDDNIPSLSQNDEDDEEGGEGDKEKKPAA